MKVKAKWAIKVNGRWHNATDVFEVESLEGLEGLVEVIEAPKQVRMEVIPEVKKPEAEAARPAEAEAKEDPKPKTAARTRKKTAEK